MISGTKPTNKIALPRDLQELKERLIGKSPRETREGLVLLAIDDWADERPDFVRDYAQRLGVTQ